ncbi:MAG: hypothetical protein AAF829_12175, partial [Pseudomonadota bacterium]
GTFEYALTARFPIKPSPHRRIPPGSRTQAQGSVWGCMHWEKERYGLQRGSKAHSLERDPSRSAAKRGSNKKALSPIHREAQRSGDQRRQP